MTGAIIIALCFSSAITVITFVFGAPAGIFFVTFVFIFMLIGTVNMLERTLETLKRVEAQLPSRKSS